jgi:hypothetical protein
MKNTLRAKPLVLLEWIDSAHDGGDWQLGEVKLDTMIIRSVGFIFKEDKKSIVLVGDYNNEEGQTVVHSRRIAIPKFAIVRRRSIRVPR